MTPKTEVQRKKRCGKRNPEIVEALVETRNGFGEDKLGGSETYKPPRIQIKAAKIKLKPKK